jgi:hypothetical protein
MCFRQEHTSVNTKTHSNSPASDSLDLTRLRLPQNFAHTVGVKKQIVAVPIRKPDRQTFVRVHPDWPAFEAAILEDSETRENYLVSADMLPELPTEARATALYAAITRQNALFLWPVRLPGVDGRQSMWQDSMLVAVAQAKRHWVRIVANMQLQAYDLFLATADIPEPDWPELSRDDVLRIAFRDRIIDSPDHPVVRRLQGSL